MNLNNNEGAAQNVKQEDKERLMKYYQDKVVIQVFGHTGVGKSSLINTLLEYLGVEERAQVGNDVNSVTKSVRKFACHDYIIVDTPGIGDTQGEDVDEQNYAMIIDTATECCHINALVIVINAQMPRLDGPDREAIKRLVQSFPDNDILLNTIFVFTRVGNNPKKCSQAAKKLTASLLEELGREDEEFEIPYTHIDNDPMGSAENNYDEDDERGRRNYVNKRLELNKTQLNNFFLEVVKQEEFDTTSAIKQLSEHQKLIIQKDIEMEHLKEEEEEKRRILEEERRKAVEEKMKAELDKVSAEQQRALAQQQLEDAQKIAEQLKKERETEMAQLAYQIRYQPFEKGNSKLYIEMMTAAVAQLTYRKGQNGIEFIYTSDLFIIWKQSRRWWWHNGPFNRKFQQAQNLMEGLLQYGCDRELEKWIGRECIRKEAIVDLHAALQQLI